MKNFDKDAPIPLYYQLKEIIREDIDKNRLVPGQPIPSERELVERYNISRMTVRQAVSGLVNEGYLYRQHGKGTFVADLKIKKGLLKLPGFSRDMSERGLKTRSRVLESAEISAGLRLAKTLDIKAEDKVYRIKRLRLVNGRPMALETTHLAAKFCQGLLDEDLSKESVFSLLETKYNLKLKNSYQVLEPVLASEEEAELLGIKKDHPVLVMEGTTFLTNGRPIEYVRGVYRSDRYKFFVELHR
ncbi:MAG: GntR family transcriptional regulator [Candidatus Omnitrophica bacterium]|nr:GntR family transcriptional regulator [Candidatus Omnitrophota bacterium]